MLTPAGKVVVLVDDGLATGVTARAACEAMRASGAAAVVLAVPVGSAHTVAELQQQHVADIVICLRTPKRFRAVGGHYLVSELHACYMAITMPWAGHDGFWLLCTVEAHIMRQVDLPDESAAGCVASLLCCQCLASATSATALLPAFRTAHVPQTWLCVSCRTSVRLQMRKLLL